MHDGLSIMCKYDSGIPQTFPDKPRVRDDYDPNIICASQLLDPSTNSWDNIRVRNNFVEKDANFILSLSVGGYRQDDRLVWHQERHGRYMKEINSALKGHEESQDFIQMVVFILWSLWKARNNLVFCHIHQQPQDIIASALNHQDMFKAANTLSLPPLRDSDVPSPYWESPRAGVLKVTCDAVSDKFWNMGALAVILRDHNSQVIDWLCVPVSHILDPLVLENMACIGAVSLARNRNINNLIVKGDCKVLFDGLCSGKVPL
ncbi:hypothetical protein MANES_15G180112v8 [Manihot esculenta]|uniref:Uncharacterized protein n=1 Tax=Manihot esculenta TaxID=3983 RepID=A0ACB7GDV5_MANES|nr:hypothetical protein MANES_15G180112v8 [Manihot esculenta]